MSCRRWVIAFLPLAVVASTVQPAAAATYTYDAGATTNPGLLWSAAANWVGDVTPTFNNETDLIFDVETPGTNMRIGADRIVRSMVFGATQNANNTVVATRADGSGARTLTLEANTGNAKIEQSSLFPGGLLRIGTNNEGDVILGSNVDVYANSPTAPVQFDSIVTGGGAINKYGVGTVSVTRNNTFSGGINIFQGVADVFSNANAAGTGTITVGGVDSADDATLSVGTTATRPNAITVNAGAGARTILMRSTTASGGNPTLSGTVTLNKAATFEVELVTASTQDRMTLSGQVSGTGGIVKTNTGILILSGSGNNYTGTTDIQGGKLYLAGNGRLGSGAVTIASGANLDFATSTSGTNFVANNISGDGQIFQNLASTDTRFTGDVTNTGGLTINTGVVRIGNGGTTGSYTGDTTVASGATLAFARSDDYTHGGTISGAGGVSKTAAGTATVTGSNSYSGNTALFTGVLVADHANALGTGNIVFNAAGGGGTLRYTAASAGTDWATRIVNSSAPIRLDTGTNTVILAGVIVSTNTNGLVKSGSGVLALGGSNSYVGTTTVSEGQLIIADANALGGTADGTTVASGASLRLAPTAGTMTVAEPLTISGTSVPALRSNSGTTTLQGPITLAAASRIEAASGSRLTIDVASGNAITANNFSLRVEGAGAVDVNDPISLGTGGIAKAGSGVLTLGAANSYSGTTSVSLGTLRLGNAAALGANNSTVMSLTGGTLDLAGFDATLNAPTLSSGSITLGGGNLTLGLTGGGVTMASVISGSGNVTKDGAGALIVNAPSTYSGDTTLADGSIQGGAVNDFLPTNTVLRFGATANDRWLTLQGRSQTLAGLTDAAATGGSRIVESATEGTSNSPATLSLDVAAEASFVFGGSLRDAAGEATNSLLALVKNGQGTQVLSGDNTYNGTTTVSAGGLIIDGTHSGLGLASVARGARIGGTGSLAGGLSILSGGLFVFNPLNPTLDVAGTVTLDNTFSVESLVNLDGTAINWGSVADGTYTLIGTTASSFSNITNFGDNDPYDIGGGRSAYFQNGSLQLVVVPEPSTFALLGGVAAVGVFMMRRRRTIG